jgi:acyl-homoserine lactone acylase PvdQ
MYILIGRTEDYAWSLTSASHDVRDVFAEMLCNPDGSDPTAESDHYEFDGECRPFEVFNAGTLDGQPITYPVSKHGPVIGTATSDGRPIALTRQRSTFGRDGLNLVALKRMTEGAAATPEDFYDTANEFGFTFNWGWIGRQETAYFSSGRLPERAAGLDRRLPVLGTGDYEWQGYLDQDEHPHGDSHSSARLLNWNNQSAPGFMHGDGTSFGSIHRVETFDQWPDPVDLAGVVGVMNRSATEFPDSQVWPVVSEVLSGSDAPSEPAQAAVDHLDAWVEDDAPAVDANNDGLFDDAGPTITEALWEPMVLAAIDPVFGDLSQSVYEERDLDGDNGASILDKDLRTLLDADVEGPFNLQYCGGGSLESCRDALWGVVDAVASELTAQYGNDDPSTWLSEGWRTDFEPGLIPETFRTTNRPTFQQVIEFSPEREDG